MQNTDPNETLFERARAVIPGGVNSPVRAFRAVGGTPRFVKRAQGAYFWDAADRRYIDYIGSWGPMILGHGHPAVVEAVQRAVTEGFSFGAPTEREIELAEAILALVPSMEMVRLVSSGTEAAMSALRLARGATGRKYIIKFEGCYHGHADAFLVQAGSGATTLGVPTSPGVPAAASAETLLARYNDLRSVEAAVEQHQGQIAAIIVEPIAGNMGVVAPQQGFLEGLRETCDRHGIVLVFDEVISGFRAATGGAQKVFRVRPDLTCLGKIIGGGLPVGAYGGRAGIMGLVAPAGPVYQAGTLSGNPLAMAAGIWALEALSPRLYTHLARLGGALASGLADAARAARVPLQVNAFGSLLTPFFTDRPVRDYQSALTVDTTAYAQFFRGMLARGIYPPPSQFEAWFLSGAHTPRDIEKTVDAAREVMKTIGSSRAS
jgi:glutamate-1-semialdehyde 2,1-aminomutase